jgi:hypothetical protein
VSTVRYDGRGIRWSKSCWASCAAHPQVGASVTRSPKNGSAVTLCIQTGPHSLCTEPDGTSPSRWSSDSPIPAPVPKHALARARARARARAPRPRPQELRYTGAPPLGRAVRPQNGFVQPRLREAGRHGCIRSQTQAISSERCRMAARLSCALRTRTRNVRSAEQRSAPNYQAFPPPIAPFRDACLPA